MAYAPGSMVRSLHPPRGRIALCLHPFQTAGNTPVSGAKPLPAGASTRRPTGTAGPPGHVGRNDQAPPVPRGTAAWRPPARQLLRPDWWTHCGTHVHNPPPTCVIGAPTSGLGAGPRESRLWESQILVVDDAGDGGPVHRTDVEASANPNRQAPVLHNPGGPVHTCRWKPTRVLTRVEPCPSTQSTGPTTTSMNSSANSCFMDETPRFCGQPPQLRSLAGDAFHRVVVHSQPGTDGPMRRFLPQGVGCFDHRRCEAT